MAKRKPKQMAANSRASKAWRVPGLLTGHPTLAGVAWLMAIVVVIGVSGLYLAVRFGGLGTQAAGRTEQDPATPWRARLLRDPQDVEALLALAHVELDQQRLDEAESIYRQVLAKEPKNVEAITHLGTVMLGRGEVAVALRHYNQALAIQPDYVHALWDKGNLLQQVMQDYPEAIRTWEAFIRAVGPGSQDGKTAQQFIAEAREAMQTASPVEKAFGKTP